MRDQVVDKGMGRTMKRVLMTHNGFVHVVLVAPAIMADRICRVQV